MVLLVEVHIYVCGNRRSTKEKKDKLENKKEEEKICLCHFKGLASEGDPTVQDASGVSGIQSYH